MVQEALVIPVDVLEPVRVVEYSHPRDLLDLLYREIGCDCVDATPTLPSRFGSFVLWLDDVGLLKQPVEHNDRAIALCRAVGYAVPDLAGTAVITGSADGTGDTRTIPATVRDHLVNIFQSPSVERTNTEAEVGRAAAPRSGGRGTRDTCAAEEPSRRDLGGAGGGAHRDNRGPGPRSSPGASRGHVLE